jgi:hypothetical protein
LINVTLAEWRLFPTVVGASAFLHPSISIHYATHTTRATRKGPFLLRASELTLSVVAHISFILWYFIILLNVLDLSLFGFTLMPFFQLLLSSVSA